jgi:hypothetical protein
VTNVTSGTYDIILWTSNHIVISSHRWHIHCIFVVVNVTFWHCGCWFWNVSKIAFATKASFMVSQSLMTKNLYCCDSNAWWKNYIEFFLMLVNLPTMNYFLFTIHLYMVCISFFLLDLVDLEFQLWASHVI